MVLATTGAIRGSSRKKLYQQLGLEDLHQRRWMSRCFCLLDKVLSTEKPTYIYALLPSLWKAFRDLNTFNAFSYPNISRTLFFSHVINEWNNVDLIRGSRSYWLFRKSNPYWSLSLREKYPNTEFFLVRISPHSDWIRRYAEYLSVFSPNVGKYRPGKTTYLGTFHAVY